MFAAFALKPEYGGFGPASIGFYRVFFALPLMVAGAVGSTGKSHPAHHREKCPTGLLALAGFFFAVDLVSWHWSIKFTTVAKRHVARELRAALGHVVGGRLFGEKIQPRFFIALGLAFVGAFILMGASFQLSPDQLFR